MASAACPPLRAARPSDEEPTATTTSSAANASESVRVGTRCWSSVPEHAPARPGCRARARPAARDRRASRRRRAFERDQPDGGERGRHRRPRDNAARRISSGTMTIPPPTPKSAPKNPAASPIEDEAHRPILGAWLPHPPGAARRRPARSGAPPRRRRDAGADRRPAGAGRGSRGDAGRVSSGSASGTGSSPA